MASSASNWQSSDIGDDNSQNSHPQNATYRRKSYEPFRCVLICVLVLV